VIEYQLYDVNDVLIAGGPHTLTLVDGTLTSIDFHGATEVGRIDFSYADGDPNAAEYRISGITGVVQEIEGDVFDTFNLGVVDSDGDSSSTTLDVVFEGTETLEGSDGVDDAIGGSDLDEIMTGGTGADIFAAGDGDDHITDYDLDTDGDLVDISNIFDASAGGGSGDILEASDDGTGNVKLTIIDGNDGVTEKGSITFDNIAHDVSYETDINNLLGPVIDVDTDGDGSGDF
jgi:hypothetical protein